jgi:hypothetical protein
MTAELISADPDAFIITPLQDMEEQWLTNTEPTDWKWTVKAKKGGNQILTLIINRIVQVDGKDYSRPVASYTRNLYVTVTVPSIISQIDWKWSLTTIFIPIIIWLYKRRKPDAGQTPKPAK